MCFLHHKATLNSVFALKNRDFQSCVCRSGTQAPQKFNSFPRLLLKCLL